MSKKSVLAREKKRQSLIALDSQKRKLLKEKIKDPKLSFAEKIACIQKLHSMRRDGSKVRHRNRCFITGRPRAYIGDFGISRIKMIEMAHMIPGLQQGSW